MSTFWSNLYSGGNILVIDDEREFNFPAVYARNLADARKLITSRHWDQVWLDNDLGNDEEVKTLVKEIEWAYWGGKEGQELGHEYDVDMFVIHTQNPVARNWM